MMLRLIVLTCMAGMGIYMAKGAWAAAVHRGERYGDAMRLASFATAAVFCGYQLRALLVPESEVLLNVLHILAIGDALLIVRLGQRYGRGPLLKGARDDAE